MTSDSDIRDHRIETTVTWATRLQAQSRQSDALSERRLLVYEVEPADTSSINRYGALPQRHV